MSEKKYYWFKMKDDFFQTKEIKRLRKIAGGDTFTIIYLKMILKSLQNGGKLFFEGFEKDIIEELSLDIDEDADNVKITFDYLALHQIIVSNDQYEFKINGAVENIGSESSTAIRVRKHREKKKSLQCNTNVTPVKQIVNGEKEKEIKLDIDINIELDKDKKNKSSLEKFNIYGDLKNVLLTQLQYDQLVIDYGEKITKKYINSLSLYEKMGKYKDHNRTIRTWINRDNIEKLSDKKSSLEKNKNLKELKLAKEKLETFDRTFSGEVKYFIEKIFPKKEFRDFIKYFKKIKEPLNGYTELNYNDYLDKIKFGLVIKKNGKMTLSDNPEIYIKNKRNKLIEKIKELS